MDDRPVIDGIFVLAKYLEDITLKSSTYKGQATENSVESILGSIPRSVFEMVSHFAKSMDVGMAVVLLQSSEFLHLCSGFTGFALFAIESGKPEVSLCCQWAFFLDRYDTRPCFLGCVYIACGRSRFPQ